MRADLTGRSGLGRAIADALREAAPDVVALPAGGWGFALANGSAASVRARVVSGEWLELVTSIKAAGHDRWGLLAMNTRLTGSARLAIGSHQDIQLRSESFIGESPDESESPHGDGHLAEVVRAVCGDMRLAVHQVRKCLDAPAAIGPIAAEMTASGAEWPGGDRAVEAADALAALCAEAGWTATARTGGDVVVPIEARGASFQARLARSADGALLAMVPFVDAAVHTRWCREAAAALLLRLGASVRLVKGVVVPQGDGVFAGIGTAVVPPRTAADVSRVLDALAVGCALAGRETQALADEGLARAYLALEHPVAGTE